MRILAITAAALLMAAPVVAGNWAPGYTWSWDDEGGSKFMNDYLATEGQAWGMGFEYSNPWGTQDPNLLRTAQYVEWTTDRLGNPGKAQRDVMLGGGKIKWRTDTAWASLIASGPGLNFSGQPAGIVVGMKIGASGSGYPALYVRNSLGGAQIGYTATPTTYFGVQTNFKSNRSQTVVDQISGNWLVSAGQWCTLKLVMHNDAAKTWEAWLVHGLDDPSSAAYMKGHATGDAGNYIQYGFLGTVDNKDVTWDYVAFGTGYDNIGDIPVFVPEPASLLALSIGLAGIVGLMRRRG